MTRFTAIDLSTLAAPNVIDALDYEVILEALKADLIVRLAADGITYDMATIESDPAIKVLEVAAFRELQLRAYFNDKIRAILLASAKGTDLDHLGVYYATERLLVTPATGTTAAVYETDAEFRARIQAAPEAFSTAGPEGAYIYHAMTADASIKHAAVYSHGDGLAPGIVHLYLLTRTGNGVPDQTLIDKVSAYLKAGDRDKVPATDILSVLPAVPEDYAVTVNLFIPSGPDPLLLKQQAETALAAYVAQRHRVGISVPVSALSRAAFVDGVERVEVTSPTADIPATMGVAPYCTGITVTTTAI